LRGTSKQHQAVARATVRHLHLDSYYEGLAEAYPFRALLRLSKHFNTVASTGS
jgi:hypothetical protein